MRFLADESCDFRVIRALRAAGHDVVAVAEVAADTEDDAVIEMAIHEGRIFVTVLDRRRWRTRTGRAAALLRRGSEKGEANRLYLGLASVTHRSIGAVAGGERAVIRHPTPSTVRADGRYRQMGLRIL
jgi:uncharacterized protein with PIN domain